MIQPPTNNEVQRSPTDNSYKNSRSEITQPPTSNILSSRTDNVNSRTHGVQTTIVRICKVIELIMKIVALTVHRNRSGRHDSPED